MSQPTYPPVPTRIVEPLVSPETTAPTPAVEAPACEECTVSGNEALAAAGRRGKKPQPEAPAPEPEP